MKHDPKAIVADGTIAATLPLAAFAAAVKLAGSAPECGQRSTIPILNYLMVTPDAVEYRGLDMSVRAPFVGGVGGGRVLLPAKTLAAVLSAMTTETVTLAMGAKSEVIITGGDVTAKVLTLPVVDAPDFFEIETSRNVSKSKAAATLDVKDGIQDLTPTLRDFALAEGVAAALFALTLPFVSSEETRYYLNGVAFHAADDGEGSRLTAVATNGHRLGKKSTTLPRLEAFGARIVPREFAGYLAKVAGGGEVRVRMSSMRAVFTLRDAVLSTKLIDGTFPDYGRVVPQPGAGAMTFGAAEVVRFLSAGAKMANERGRAVKIERKGDAVAFTIASPDFGSISTKMVAEIDGEPTVSVGFNTRYVVDIFKAFRAKRLRFEQAEPGSPCRITNPDAPDDALAVLMPMRV